MNLGALYMYSFLTSGWLQHNMQHACYNIFHKASSVYLQNTSAKRMREIWPAVLVGESSTQLLMYSLDHDRRQILYILTNFQISERLQ